MSEVILLGLVAFVVVMGVLFGGWWFFGGRFAAAVRQGRSENADRAMDLLRDVLDQDETWPVISESKRAEIEEVLRRHERTEPEETTK